MLLFDSYLCGRRCADLKGIRSHKYFRQSSTHCANNPFIEICRAISLVSGCCYRIDHAIYTPDMIFLKQRCKIMLKRKCYPTTLIAVVCQSTMSELVVPSRELLCPIYQLVRLVNWPTFFWQYVNFGTLINWEPIDISPLTN